MAKPKYRLWVTLLPKRPALYANEAPQPYPRTSYIIAASEGHATDMMAMRNLGESLRQPDQAPAWPKNRMVRQTPKNLSRFLLNRIERGTPWVSVSYGSYLGPFLQLAVAQNLITPTETAQLVIALGMYGCRDRTLTDWIAEIENQLPGHTLEYAKGYFDAHPF